MLRGSATGNKNAYIMNTIATNTIMVALPRLLTLDKRLNGLTTLHTRAAWGAKLKCL